MRSLLDPAILFFVFGMLAGALKSNLEIPQQMVRFLSLYLLMALGLKGGFALSQTGLTAEVAVGLLSALLLATTVPLASYLLLRRLLNPFDAAAVAATYGSVSAVTFITAVQHLENLGIPHGGHMSAAMALMESPAIILAVVLANRLRHRQAQTNLGGAAVQAVSMRHVLHEAITDGSQLLLLGAMLVGILSAEAGKVAMQPFVGDLFKGLLCFFLLDMGLQAARHLGDLKGKSRVLVAYALLAPLVHAAAAAGLASLCGMSVGNAALLMVLAASASYIAVPAVVRQVIPEANPALYVGMSLGVTFPFNILVGIPLYTNVARTLM